MTTKLLKSLPSAEVEQHGILCRTRSGQEYVITHVVLSAKNHRFTLWRGDDASGYEKLSTAKSPYELYEKIPWQR